MPWRHAKPASTGAKQIALIGKTKQVGHLAQTAVRVAQVLAGQLAPGFVQQLRKAAGLGQKAALQGAIGQVQACCDVVAARLSLVQNTRQFAAHARADVGLAELVQPFFDQPTMQFPQTGVVRGNRAEHVLSGQQHAAGRLVKAHGHAKSNPKRARVDRRRINPFHCQRFDLLACEPLAQHEQGQHAVLHALARYWAGSADVAKGQPEPLGIVFL